MRSSPKSRLAAVLLASLLGAASARAQSVSFATGTALGVSSITWSWIGSGAGFRVLAGPGGANLSGDLPPTAASFTLTGLSANAPATAVVEAFTGASTADSAPQTVYTAAAAPTGTTLLGTNVNQVSLSWQANGNPAGTTYDVLWSTVATSPIHFSTVSAAGTPVTATIRYLPGGLAVSFMVQAVNAQGLPSGYDVAVSTVLPVIANQPAISTMTVADGVSSITWYWSASTGALAYQLFSSTDGAVSPVLPPTALSYTQTGLLANTSYTNYVHAFDIPTSTNSAPLTRYTLAAQTNGLTLLGLSSPAQSGLGTTAELLSWGANGNSASTVYDVLWWTNLTATVTVAVSSPATSALIGGLYGGSTVYFTVQAQNGEGILAPFDATFFSPGFAVRQSTFFPVGGRILPTGYSGVLTFVVPDHAGTGAGVITIQVASGTFAVPVTLSVSTPDASAPFPEVGGGFSDLPNPIHLTILALDEFGAARQPILPVILTVTDAASNAAANGTTLDICRFDAVRRVWIPLATAKNGGALTAASDHLTSFAVLSGAAATSLSEVSVGPNPLRPILNPGSVMTFRGLPAGCRVRIFTYLGEKLVDLSADGSGVVSWDGRNRSGSFVASGVYLALIEGAGTKKNMRLAIER